MTITLRPPPVHAELTDIGAMAHDMFSPARLAGTLGRILALSEQMFGCDTAGFVLSAGDQQIIPFAAADPERAQLLRAVQTRANPGQAQGSRPRPQQPQSVGNVSEKP